MDRELAVFVSAWRIASPELEAMRDRDLLATPLAGLPLALMPFRVGTARVPLASVPMKSPSIFTTS